MNKNSSTENIIELIDVRKVFDDETVAVDNFNLQVRRVSSSLFRPVGMRKDDSGPVYHAGIPPGRRGDLFRGNGHC